MIKVFSKREKLILYSTIGIIVLSVAFNILIEPFLSKYEKLNKEININRVKLKHYIRLLSQKEYLEQRYNKLSVSSGENSVLTQNENTGTLSGIEELAKNAGVKIVDMRPQNSRNVSGNKENFVELNAEGGMENYLKFLYNIENSLSLMRVETFRLNLKPNATLLEGNFLISQIQLD